MHLVLAFTLPCGIIHMNYSVGFAQSRVGSTREGAVGSRGIAGCILSLCLFERGHVLVIMCVICLYMS